MIDLALILLPLVLLAYCIMLSRKLKALRVQLSEIGPVLDKVSQSIDRAEEMLARARAGNGGPLPASAEVIDLQRRTGTGGPDMASRFFGGR